jgi:hypothetical protein
MKSLILFVLSVSLAVAQPTTPLNNVVVKTGNVAQTGLLQVNGSSPASAATVANLSTALDLIGSTRGSIVYRGAAGWAALVPGASGYVLTSNGAGADPSYTAIPGFVTSFSFTNANGVTGVVTNPTTTPNLTLSVDNAKPQDYELLGSGGASDVSIDWDQNYLGSGVWTFFDGAQIDDASAVISADSALVLRRAITGSGSNSHGVSDNSVFSMNGGSDSYNSYDARATFNGITNFDHYAAFQSLPIFNFTGTMADYYGLYTGAVVTAGTITNSFGLYVNNPSGAGMVTNNYGIYISSMTYGANDWSIYSVGGNNVLLGGLNDTPIGAISPSSVFATTVQTSGNLAVGARARGPQLVDVSIGTESGWTFYSTDSTAHFSRDSGNAVYARRRVTDGPVVSFFRDTTQAGSVAASSTGVSLDGTAYSSLSVGGSVIAESTADGLEVFNRLTLPISAVGSLPSAAASEGAIAYVNDATATTRLSVAAGGGSNKVLVFSDGANWLIL